MKSCTGSAAEVNISKLPPPATTQVDFARDIRPILETSCLRCHGPEKSKSRFRLDNREAALKGGEHGIDILPGNSAQSPLIHYTAQLVEDMEMPPVGKGDPLTPQQVSLLRAWIDQGAAWDSGKPAVPYDYSFAPTLGGTVVNGDAHKFREHYWQKEGENGGLEHFELFDQRGPDTTLLVNGHALVNDCKIDFLLQKHDLGFIHSGWEQYRKYYDDTGGYYPALVPTPLSLGQDLYLDIGRAWVDFGLTLPGWPRMVLGYEYDYKFGNEAITQWGSVGTTRATARNIAPASKHIHEDVHIIKFDFDAEVAGISVQDRFRGEFYNLNTDGTNVVFRQMPQSISESTTYFQGANSLRLDKKFQEWLYGSAGYLYSKLNAESGFQMEVPTLLQKTSIPRIDLERESQVGNANVLLGPWSGLTFSAGVQGEWTHQDGFGSGTYDQGTPTPPFAFIFPFNVASDYDENSVQENLALRFSSVPFTTFFAEARWEQETIGQYDQFAAEQDILNDAVFLQNTDFSSRSSDVRFGFNTSPWRSVTFTTLVRRYKNDSHYDTAPVVQPVPTAYPGFILWRELTTDEVETKLILHASPRLKTTLSYQYHTSDYTMDTAPFSIVTPGGQLLAGQDHSHVFSLGATITPVPRLILSGTFSYLMSSLTTAAAGSPTVVPYEGDIYTVLADGTFILTQTTDLFAGYAFSEANYSQDNFAAGLPLGIQYQQHGVQVGLRRRLSRNVSTKLAYRFAYYSEPSSGGANDYRAHAIFGTLLFHFP